MVDQITRTVRQGFLSRMANSFIGILIGLVMVPGSVCLVSWNEYRTVHRSRALAEAADVTVEVMDPFEIDSTQNERLVHVTGTATTEETLQDPEFGVEQQALRLQRKVEMFQWVEHKESKTRDKLGGGKETVTTYRYERKWQEGRENSDSFEERAGHENPPLKYSAQDRTTAQATLGSFRLSSDIIERKMNSWSELAVDQSKALSKLDEAVKQHFRIEPTRLYYSAMLPSGSEPQVGDLRISFRSVQSTQVSVLSKQAGSDLSPFKTSNGELIEHLMLGKVSTTEMFNSLKFENTMLAWILRVVGWVLSIVGFSLITGPLKTLAAIIPPLGSLVGTMSFMVSFLLGTIVTLISIAIAWIAVRPLFGITLLLLAGGAVYLLTRRSKSNTMQATGSYGPPPVPPPLPNA